MLSLGDVDNEASQYLSVLVAALGASFSTVPFVTFEKSSLI